MEQKISDRSLLDLKQDVSLAELTSLKVGGTAKYLVEIQDIQQLPEACSWATQQGLPTLFLGEGSNFLFPDYGFSGLLIRNRITGKEASGDEVNLAGGENLERSIRWLNQLQLAGMDDSKERITKVIQDGSAYEILCKMIYEHGGELNKIKHSPKHQIEIKVKDDGYIHYKNTREIGYSILNISKSKNLHQYDRMGGIELIKKNGTLVKKNDVVARIFGSNKNKLDLSKEIFENSFEVNEQIIKNKQIIY